MGNAQVAGQKRMGLRASREAEIVWKAEPFEFDSEEVGLAPAEVVAEVHMKLNDKAGMHTWTHKWVVEESFASEKNHQIATWTSPPTTEETVTSFCSLPSVWPAGRYRVDVFVGDAQEAVLVDSMPFVITAKGNQMASATLTHEGVPFETMERGFGPIRVVFESRFKCDVREDSHIEWRLRENSLMRLAVPAGTYSIFHSDLRLQEPWPVGSYDVRLTLDGTLVHTKQFQCRDGWAGRVFSKTTPEGLFPGSGELFVFFDIGEKQMIKERGQVVWLFEDRTEVAIVTLARGECNTVNCNVTLAPGTPWPLGPYAVELHIDGAVVGRRTFHIVAQPPPAAEEQPKK